VQLEFALFPAFSVLPIQGLLVKAFWSHCCH